MSGPFNPPFGGDGNGSGGTGASTLDALNGVAYNTMMIHDLHAVEGIVMGDAYITAFESDDQGPGSAATYDGAADTYDTASSGNKSVGSIDVAGDSDSVVTSLTVGGDELLSGDVTPLKYTDYDGSSYQTGDDTITGAGAQAWCFELWLDELTTNKSLVGNYSTTGPQGVSVYFLETTDTLRLLVGNGSSNAEATYVVAGMAGQWIKVVGYNNGSSSVIYVDADPSSGASIAPAASSNNFVIGASSSSPGSNTHNGRLRNIEVYTGTITDPTAWEPGNTASMTGQASAPTLVFQSKDGSGDDNTQGVTFTTTGTIAPTQTDDIMTALKADVNETQTDWDATISATGPTGTLTLTAAAVGDNNDLTPAGVGTDVTFSNSLPTKYGVGVSPDGGGTYIGNIASPIIDITGKTIDSALCTFSHKWGSGSGTVGTDMVVEVTKDGVNWAQATTVTDLGSTLSGTTYKYYSATIDVSGLSGTSLQGRLRDLGTGKSLWFSMATYALS